MSSLKNEFEKACDYVSSNHSRIDQSVLLYLYGLYKQATVGNYNTPKPSVFDFRGHAKWKAWKKMVNKSTTEAMQLYIQILNEAVRNWNTERENTNVSNRVSVSTMPKETKLPDSAKNAFDWVKDGDLSKLKQYDALPTNLRDEEGLSLLHWAADRGHLDIVRYLIEDVKIDINCKDDGKQTPLHYAAACGHTEVCRLLIQNGADTKAVDNEGKTPKELADVPAIVDLL